MPPRATLLLALGVALIGSAGAQPAFDHEAGRPHVRLFSPADYEAHYQVWTMTQDVGGLVYIGAFGGLLEYDGSTWRQLALDAGSVRELAFTADGRLWLSANNEFGWCDRDATGTLQFHSLRPAVPPAAGEIGGLPDMVAVGNDVWLTTAHGLVRWRDGQPRFWPAAGGLSLRLYPLPGRLLRRSRGATAFQELRGEEWVTVLDDPALANRQVNFVRPAADGALIVGVNLAGLFRWHDGRLTLWKTPASELLAKARLYCATNLHDGSLAIGTITEGLVLISADGTQARQLRIADGLPSDLIEGLGTDRAGRIWICTYNGLAVIEWPTPLTLFDRRAGFDLATVQTISRQNGRMQFGGISGVYGLTPAAAGSLLPAAVERTPGVELMSGSTLRHASGTLFPANGGIKRLGDPKEDFVLKLDDIVMSLAVSRHEPDRIFFGSRRGLGSARLVQGEWQLEGYAAGMAGTSVRSVSLDEGGAVWARAIDLRLWRLPPDAAGAYDWSGAKPVRADAFPGWPETRGLRVAATMTPLGQVFFGGRAILRFDSAAQRFVPEDRFDRSHLPPGDLLPISDAGSAEIWCTVFTEGFVAGRRHVFGRFVFGADGRARWHDMPPGYAGIIGGFGVELAEPDPTHPGVVWLKGTNAIGRLDVAQLPAPATPVSPSIRRVLSGERRLPLTAGRVQLPWSQAPLVVQFAAPGDIEPRFRTRLLGWSSAWSAASTRPIAEFTGLAPGRYVFEVATQATDGSVGPAARLALVIAPPWWRTTAANTLYVLAGLGGVLGYLRWRLGRARERQRELEALVATRTAELATARDQAEAASRAKSAFLAAMSHELRTPLNGVIGYAQVLQADARLAPDQQERLRVVQASGEHLLRMINDVLDLAKIEAGKLELRLAPLPLGDLIRDIVAAQAPAAAAKRLACTCEVAPGVPAWVTGDAQKLRQILDNLVGNAIKFTARGAVALRVQPAAGEPRIQFLVQDTGPGISADDQVNLFRPFEQARQARPEVPGAGLGLAISRALVERLGGVLALQSPPGQGCTFSFAVALPAAAPELAGRPAPRVTGYEGPRRHVLIVDDNETNRRLLVDLLQPLGFECATLASGDDALAALAAPGAAWPDLAIIDVRMAGLDGLALTRRLRSLPPAAGLRVLLTSASVLTFDPAEGRRAGCDGFLAKPFRVDDLIEQLGRLLALQWCEAVVEAPRALPHPVSGRGPWPEAARSSLREVLAQGDLDEFRRQLAQVRVAHPEAEARWAELEAVAAAFELSRLRHLIEQP